MRIRKPVLCRWSCSSATSRARSPSGTCGGRPRRRTRSLLATLVPSCAPLATLLALVALAPPHPHPQNPHPCLAKRDAFFVLSLSTRVETGDTTRYRLHAIRLLFVRSQPQPREPCAELASVQSVTVDMETTLVAAVNSRVRTAHFYSYISFQLYIYFSQSIALLGLLHCMERARAGWSYNLFFGRFFSRPVVDGRFWRANRVRRCWLWRTAAHRAYA